MKNKTHLKNIIIHLLIIIFSLLLISLLILYYKLEEKKIKKHKYDELKAISELKTDQIVSWRRERLAEAQFFSTNKELIDNTKKMLSGKPEAYRSFFISHFNSTKINHGYYDIYILSAGGKILFSFDEDKTIDDKILNLIKTEIKEKQTVTTGFYYCNTHKMIHYDIIAPVINIDSEIDKKL